MMANESPPGGGAVLTLISAMSLRTAESGNTPTAKENVRGQISLGSGSVRMTRRKQNIAVVPPHHSLHDAIEKKKTPGMINKRRAVQHRPVMNRLLSSVKFFYKKGHINYGL